MTLPEFRRLVRRQFGGDLRYLTPANARDFLDRVQPQVDAPARANGRISLNEPERTYEGIVRDFLAQSLEAGDEQSFIRLWLYSLELTISSVSELEAEKFRKLFAALTADGD